MGRRRRRAHSEIHEQSQYVAVLAASSDSALRAQNQQRQRGAEGGGSRTQAEESCLRVLPQQKDLPWPGSQDMHWTSVALACEMRGAKKDIALSSEPGNSG
ncbi:unnamed protein product [Symbiodinium necroappetens]|uniref:Uncharacterized protein n=1 Tax=Symbiodinium necroappetens TaxID=1628268 RepID=A0A812XWC5_9DINO|nr:unnamed protein product [Symbiodinium necroappetens]